MANSSVSALPVALRLWPYLDCLRSIFDLGDEGFVGAQAVALVSKLVCFEMREFYEKFGNHLDLST